MDSGIVGWVAVAGIVALVAFVVWQLVARRQARAARLARADELGTRLMLEHGPVTGAQMQLVWHGIHQMIAVHGSLDAEQLRYLITEARNRQS